MRRCTDTRTDMRLGMSEASAGELALNRLDGVMRWINCGAGDSHSQLDGPD